jgi:hypothetical protein
MHDVRLEVKQDVEVEGGMVQPLFNIGDYRVTCNRLIADW